MSSTTAAATSTWRATGRRRWPSRPKTPSCSGRSRLAERLAADEEAILSELNGVQGRPVDLGGYYFVDRDKAIAVMRPSAVQRCDRVASKPRRPRTNGSGLQA